MPPASTTQAALSTAPREDPRRGKAFQEQPTCPVRIVAGGKYAPVPCRQNYLRTDCPDGAYSVEAMMRPPQVDLDPGDLPTL